MLNLPRTRLIAHEPLYTRMAADIATLIENGTMGPGERIPSVRKASRQHKVSVGTAVQAYLALENRGLVEARPKSGFFVRFQPRRLLEPQTSRPGAGVPSTDSSTLLTKILDAVTNPDVVQLGAGSPSMELLPAQKLNRILAAVARRAGPSSLEYDMPPGCLTLRRVLARRAIDWGLTVSPDEIMTTSGCMEAIVLGLRAVTRPGDLVAIESPTYFGVIQAIEQLGLRMVEIPTHPRYGLDLDVLERVVRRRRVSACVAIPNFNNPLGSQMPDEAKERFVTMLARREIPLIEDDLHGELYFGQERPRVAKAYDKKGLVILCGSFSKSVAPGYRVGWILPGRFLEKVKNLKSTSTVATATLPQLGLAEYVRHGGYDHHLRSLRHSLRRQVEQTSHAVADCFPPETKLARPSGGFFLWVELPQRVDSLRLHARALAEKISIVPGPMFSPLQNYRNCIRLSCGQRWTPRIERAIGILSYLVR